jgi:hypothetical protein
MNEDSLVNLGDFAMFFDCLAGPSQMVSDPACELGDVDYDHHIDLWDFATLQQAFGQ